MEARSRPWIFDRRTPRLLIPSGDVPRRITRDSAIPAIVLRLRPLPLMSRPKLKRQVSSASSNMTVGTATLSDCFSLNRDARKQSMKDSRYRKMQDSPVATTYQTAQVHVMLTWCARQYSQRKAETPIPRAGYASQKYFRLALHLT